MSNWNQSLSQRAGEQCVASCVTWLAPVRPSAIERAARSLQAHAGTRRFQCHEAVGISGMNEVSRYCLPASWWLVLDRLPNSNKAF